MTKQEYTRRDTKSTLELFIEKAEKLERYLVKVTNFGGLFGVIRDTKEEQWRTHPEIDGFLLTFRMFIQKADGIAIYVVSKEGQLERPKFLDLPGTSADWRETVEQAYTNIDRGITPPHLIYKDEHITRWKVLEVFIYGEHGHVTQRKNFKEWQRIPELYEMLIFEFPATLLFMFEQIRIIAKASKEELYRLTANTEAEHPTSKERREP